MKTKTFKIGKNTFGGKILQEVKELTSTEHIKSDTAFKVIVLCKGLLNLTYLSITDIINICVIEEEDYMILTYPHSS